MKTVKKLEEKVEEAIAEINEMGLKKLLPCQPVRPCLMAKGR